MFTIIYTCTRCKLEHEASFYKPENVLAGYDKPGGWSEINYTENISDRPHLCQQCTEGMKQWINRGI